MNTTKGQEQIRSLWDNIDGEIHIVYPELNIQRWALEFNKLFNDHLGSSPLVSDDLRSDRGSLELATWISRFGPHLTSGDVYAVMHITTLLSIFYGADNIIFNEAFYIDNANKKEKESILKNNIVLIGGPSGNPITFLFLKQYGLGKLFTHAPTYDFEVKLPDDTKFESKPNPNELPLGGEIEDIGVFLKAVNPFNPEKFIFAVMGSNSWGTQGAASLCCSVSGAQYMENIKKFNFNSTWVKYLPVNCTFFLQNR